MGLFDIFKRNESDKADNLPKIRSEKDAKAFLLARTKDERLTQFLYEVILAIGRDGYIEAEHGGNGKPYAAEYKFRPDDPRKTSEIQAEYQNLKKKLTSAQTDSERDQIERQIADLSGGFCTIRINVMTSDEFERQRDLIITAWKQLKEIANNMK